MVTKLSLLFVLFVGVFLTACASAPPVDPAQFGTPVKGDEIKKSVDGHRFDVHDVSYNSDHQTDLYTDGRARDIIAKKHLEDFGKWWVEEDKLCTKFPVMAAGKQLCLLLSAKDGVLTRHDGTKPYLTMKLADVTKTDFSEYGTMLKGEALKSAFSGHKFQGKSTDIDLEWTMDFKKDGRLLGFIPSGNMKDSGKWWVDGDKLCQQWKLSRGGMVVCENYYDKGGTLTRIDEKSANAVLKAE